MTEARCLDQAAKPLRARSLTAGSGAGCSRYSHGNAREGFAYEGGVASSSAPGSRSNPEQPHFGVERTRAALGNEHRAAEPAKPSKNRQCQHGRSSVRWGWNDIVEFSVRPARDPMLRRAGEFVRQRIDVTTLLMPMCSARSKSTSCHSSITGSAAFTTVNAFPRTRSANRMIDRAPSSLRAVRGINTGDSFKHLSELSADEPRAGRWAKRIRVTRLPLFGWHTRTRSAAIARIRSPQQLR